MTEPLRLSRSIVGTDEAEAVSRVLLDDGFLGMGKEVQAFEQELQAFLETTHTVACVNTGTSALHLAVAAVTEPGDEVLVQSLTYVASFQAIAAAGAVPVACEVLPATVTIDLDDAERRLTERTKAIMPVHYAGNPANLAAQYAFAERHHLRVIEDAAHAFGTVYDRRMIGAFGDIVCFSFDGIKNITSGEGGAVVTGDPLVVQYVQDARLLAVHKDTEQRYQGLRSWEFDVTHQGYRYHMSNLMAAIGRVQLARIGEFKKARQSLAKMYAALLADVPEIELLAIDLDTVLPHIYPVKVKNGLRDDLRSWLLESGIECGVHYYPNHRLTYFKSEYELPATDQIYSELVTLPLHPGVSVDDAERVVRSILGFFASRAG